jgi:hypothetical protein
VGYLYRREEKRNREIYKKNGRNGKIKPRTINKNAWEERKDEREREEKREIRKRGRTLKTVAVKRGPHYCVKLLLTLSCLVNYVLSEIHVD